MEEVAPGVHRLEFAVGTKPMAMHLLAGDRLVLIDSGLTDTPERVYLPAIEAIGRRPEEVRLVVITHAVAERYDAFAPYGLRYDPTVFAMLASWMGAPEPMDILFSGGERLRLGGEEWLAVGHVPGHTPGHLCLHNPTRRYALIGDAIFGQTQLDTAGGNVAPPPYTDVEAYRATIRAIAALDLDLLLACHYPVMRGEAIAAFVDASLRFVDLAEETTRRLLRDSIGPLTLGEAIERADPILGPFAFARDLQFALLAHLDHAVALGEATRCEHDGFVAWSWCGA